MEAVWLRSSGALSARFRRGGPHQPCRTPTAAATGTETTSTAVLAALERTPLRPPTSSTPAAPSSAPTATTNREPRFRTVSVEARCGAGPPQAFLHAPDV